LSGKGVILLLQLIEALPLLAILLVEGLLKGLAQLIEVLL
jgi:hypothetical protein